MEIATKPDYVPHRPKISKTKMPDPKDDNLLTPFLLGKRKVKVSLPKITWKEPKDGA